MEMSEAAKEAQREWARKYRAAHKEQIKEYNRRYWEKKARLMQEAKEDEEHGT